MIDVGERQRVELSHVVGYADGEAHLDMPEFGIVLFVCFISSHTKVI